MRTFPDYDSFMYEHTNHEGDIEEGNVEGDKKRKRVEQGNETSERIKEEYQSIRTTVGEVREVGT